MWSIHEQSSGSILIEKKCKIIMERNNNKKNDCRRNSNREQKGYG
jgi:hypothetical protein